MKNRRVYCFSLLKLDRVKAGHIPLSGKEEDPFIVARLIDGFVKFVEVFDFFVVDRQD